MRSKRSNNRLMHGSNGAWSHHRAMVVGDGNDLLPFLVLITRVTNTLAPFGATVLVPSPWLTLRASFFSVERCATEVRSWKENYK
jgi:hypothetical protein